MSVTAATPEQKQAASAAYKEAAAAMQAGNHEEALKGFRASYDIVASPNSHHMIVRTLDALGRHVEAYREAEATVAEAEAAAAKDKKYSRTAVAARTKRDELRGQIGMLTVNVAGAEEGASVTVGGEPLDPADWGAPQPVQPGVITVELVGADGTITREVKVDAGKDAELTIGPDEESGDGETGPTPTPSAGEGSPGLRIASYVVGGVGVVGWGIFAIAGSMHLAKYNELEGDVCDYGALCPPGTQADIDRGRTYQTAANVGAGVGIVGLTAGVIMFIASQPDVRFEAGGSSLTPTVDVGPGVVTVKGRF